MRSLSLLPLAALLSLASCSNNDDPIPVIPPSDGDSFALNGGTGGSAAVNSVFVDFSAPKQDSVKRASWDLGLYAGSNFRVILNNTTSALARSVDKNDLNAVTVEDTAGMVLALSQAEPSADDFVMLDDIDGDLSKTVIAEVSATDASNKVYILNRGTGGSTPARDWLKTRVLRNGSGYAVQYAPIAATTYQTVQVTKNDKYNFNYISFDGGTAVTVEPEKTNWDIEWTYSVYKTSFGAGDVPYSFSDLVAINYLAGVQAAEVLTSTVSYDDYSDANISSTTFSGARWVIGSNWRVTGGPGGTSGAGVKTDRFYVIKDANGNYYKLKFVSFIAADGGTRGKPEITFKLVKAAQ
ncbi:MAG: HmuY family protein [Flavihumibacter sp.]